MIDKAIVLAAGMGTRIAQASGGRVPKPLLPLDDDLTFLDWHLRALAAHGVADVYLVGSPATYGAHVPAMDLVRTTWILNDAPGATSGSGHSAHLAFTSGHDVLDGRSRVILMDADLVYDPSLFGELAARRGRSKTLVCARHRDTGEEVVVFADPSGVPRVHGKALVGSPLVRGLTALGEATGILLLEPGDHALFRAAAAWCMRYATCRTRSEHEDVTQRLFAIGAIEAVVFDDDGRFMECDTPEEYAIARAVMTPRWRSALPQPLPRRR